MDINLGNIPIQIDNNNVEVSVKKSPVKVKKPRAKKEIIIENSPYKVENEYIQYYGDIPKLVTYTQWLLICNLVQNSKIFRDTYKDEYFKFGALEETGFIYPVYTKEPQEIKNFDGVVIETIPGVYDQERTLVLPPKFIFMIYRQCLFSQQTLQPYLQQVKLVNFEKYSYKMNSGPRDEQKELAEIAGKALELQKFFKGIVQCPPGWGKTFISVHISSLIQAKTVIVVPNKLLKDQWIKSIVEFTNLTEDDIGLLEGSDLSKLKRKGQIDKPIMIALIQSIDSQMKRNSFEDLVDFYRNVGAVFYDETHTSGAADGYAKTTGLFTTFNIIGLSATPYKKDKNLFQLYTGIGQIVYISTHQNLIPTCNMHLLPVKIAQSDLNNLFDLYQKNLYNLFLTRLEELLFKDHYYFVFLTEWLLYRYQQGYSTVILFKTNKMLDKLKMYVEQKCQKMSQVDSTFISPKGTILTKDTAKTMSHELSTSDIIYSNFKMFSAGADYPHLSSIFFGSMILGKTAIIQSLGRTTRKYSNKIQDVQAHFFLPKFIYPLYAKDEPHAVISRAVKVQYPSAQFRWDKYFTEYFQEKKQAAEALQVKVYTDFQNQQTNGQSIVAGRGVLNGTYQIQNTNTDQNRLTIYQEYQNNLNTQSNGLPQKPNEGFFNGYNVNIIPTITIN